MKFTFSKHASHQSDNNDSSADDKTVNDKSACNPNSSVMELVLISCLADDDILLILNFHCGVIHYDETLVSLK